MQLREREAERRCAGRARVFERRARHRKVSGRAPVGEHRGIARDRLSEAQGNLVGSRPYRAARRERRGDCGRRFGRRAGKTFRDRMKHELVHGTRVAKADLDLCRMDVDVHPARVDLEKKHVRGMAFAV